MRMNWLPDKLDFLIIKELIRRYGWVIELGILLCFMIGILCGMLSGCSPATHSQTVRTDYYDAGYRRTGYSIQEGDRIDYYNANNERIGYGRVE